MAGHSKWKNIQSRKGAQDVRKAKVFTKLLKEIVVAVKASGGDPDTNPRLRGVLLHARNANMPRDNIERAIKKAMGDDQERYEEITYEGHGPEGVGIFVECATDNPTRTVANIRSYFHKSQGSLGRDGCLQFLFHQKGVFEFAKDGLDEEDFTLKMIDAGASDVEFEEERVTVFCLREDFGELQKNIHQMNLSPLQASLQRVPQEMKDVSYDHFVKIMKLVERLEEDDDVQHVYHNMSYNDEHALRYEKEN